MKKPKQFSPLESGAKKFKPARLYDKVEWVEFRNKFLLVNTKCYSCGLRARAVDHIIAFKGDEKLFWETTNYMPLCFSCHNTITVNFDRFNPPKTNEKLQWINSKRLETGTSIKIKILDHKNTEIFIDDRDILNLE